MELTQEIHASMKAFMQINSASYLHLGELDLADLHQLCCDTDVEENSLEGRPLNVGPSSNSLRN